MEDVQETLQAAQQYIQESIATGLQQGWNWFSSLSQEEWMIVLGVVSLIGFLLVRGLGTRHRI